MDGLFEPIRIETLSNRVKTLGGGGGGAGIVLGAGFRARNVSIFQSTFRVARIRFFRAGRFGTSATGVSAVGGRRGGNDSCRWIRRNGIGNRSGRRRSFAPGETGIDRRIRECPGRNRDKGIYKYRVSIQMVIDYINHVRESYSVSVYYFLFREWVGRADRADRADKYVAPKPI